MTGLARVAENVAMYKGLTHRGSAAPDGASPLGLATVAVEGRDPDQGRQYLREWLRDGADRAAPCRVQLEVEACFAPLLRWVLAWWKGTELSLAVDPTAKGEDLVVLVVSVVYRGLALAVATRWVLAYGTRVEEARLRGLAPGRGPGPAPEPVAVGLVPSPAAPSPRLRLVPGLAAAPVGTGSAGAAAVGGPARRLTQSLHNIADGGFTYRCQPHYLPADRRRAGAGPPSGRRSGHALAGGGRGLRGEAPVRHLDRAPSPGPRGAPAPADRHPAGQDRRRPPCLPPLD